ncbi:MAG: hypothetical protein ACYC6T_10230 [Thermoleophilia bacterium]
MESNAHRVAALIYGSISIGAAALFFLVTSLTADYPPVARVGGAIWILLLTLIVTMPIVIPRVRSRLVPVHVASSKQSDGGRRK